jgi:hypothetical protein
LERAHRDGYDEPVWEVELIGRVKREPQGRLIIGMETGCIHAWQPVE